MVLSNGVKVKINMILHFAFFGSCSKQVPLDIKYRPPTSCFIWNRVKTTEVKHALMAISLFQKIERYNANKTTQEGEGR